VSAGTRRPPPEPFGAPYHQRKLVVIRELRDGFLGFGAVREGPSGKAWIASMDTAVRELDLPVGHPQPDQAYAGHPLVPRRYVPVKEFHRAIFEEKVHELLRMLGALGATRVRMTCVQGFGLVRRGKAGFEIPMQPSAGVGAEFSEERGREAHYEEVYQARNEVRLPDDLLWFHHEKSWQELARRRLEQETRSFIASLEHKDSYGIDADLLLGIQGMGLQLGAGFHEFQTSVWQFEGEFAPVVRPAPPASLVEPAAPAAQARPAAAPPVQAPRPAAPSPRDAEPLPSAAMTGAPVPVRTRVPQRRAPAPAAVAVAPSARRPVTACPTCANDVRPGDTFCDHCGTPLSTAHPCRYCGARVPAEDRFCATCGQPS
jgi:hypothetical protein